MLSHHSFPVSNFIKPIRYKLQFDDLVNHLQFGFIFGANNHYT
jgi:hypothetical protein